LSALIECATDFQSLDAARDIVNVILGVVDNPHEARPEGEHFIGQMTKEFVISNYCDESLAHPPFFIVF